MIPISVADGLNKTLFGEAINPIKAVIYAKEEAFEKASKIDEIFVMDKLDSYAGDYTYTTSYGNFKRTPENGLYAKTSSQEGYKKSIRPYEFTNSFSITKTAMEDGKLLSAKSEASKFMTAYYRTRELYAAKVLGEGASTSFTFDGETYGIAGADTKALFATDHPSVTGGSEQSNLFANAFSYDNVLRMEEKMQKLTDDNGNLLNLMPDTIIIPNSFTVKKALGESYGALQAPGSANYNDNLLFGRFNVIVWNYLNNPDDATSDMWIMADSTYNQDALGLIFADRIPLEIESRIDADTKANIWDGRARFAAEPNDWRGFMCSYAGSGGDDITA